MEDEKSSGSEKQEATDEQQGASATQQAVAATTTTTTTMTATTAVIRSYECNFCKRGFTNAQALGGHMNIHRKDKAKLKQSSTSTIATSDIPPTPQPQHLPPCPNFFPPPNMFPNHPINRPSGQGKWTFSSSKDHKSTTGTADSITSKSITHEVKKQLSLLADHHQHQIPLPPPPPSPPPAEEPPELDLELRLGHNTTDQPSSDQKGTRKFF